MPQFCMLFYAKYSLLSWRPKGGSMAQWPPLNTPLVRRKASRLQTISIILKVSTTNQLFTQSINSFTKKHNLLATNESSHHKHSPLHHRNQKIKYSNVSCACTLNKHHLCARPRKQGKAWQTRVPASWRLMLEHTLLAFPKGAELGCNFCELQM